VISSPATQADPGLICRLEAHAVDAWPATVTSRTADGWVLRATPGVDRGRSNHALTPCRRLDAAEIPGAIERVESFARRHRIACGIQVSPLSLHAPLMAELDRRGWETRWPVLVLAAERRDDVWSGGDAEECLVRADRATTEWLAAWERCEQRPRAEVEAHAATVFARLAGRATFARLDDAAVGIAVEGDGLVGLFCLAVDPVRRRGGLGTALVRALLAGSSASVAYLQVEQANAPAIGLYSRLGFGERYRYCHRVGRPPRGC
jgi:ribosomal protein S18 acetylase RimI-like enzyme